MSGLGNGVRGPMATLIIFSMVVNGALLLVLSILTSIVHHQLTTRRDSCPDVTIHPASLSDDVTKVGDVMHPDVRGLAGEDIRRYCFKEDAASCLETGGDVKQSKDGDSLCCRHFGSHLFSVMAKMVTDKLQQDSFRGQWFQKIRSYMAQLQQDSQTAIFRPAAHVRIVQNGDMTGLGDEMSTLRWNATGEESFLTGGILHRGDRLAVTKPGYYYVYSGLQFDVDPTSIKSSAIVAYLFRTVNGTDETRTKLMTSRESSCRSTRSDSVTGPVSMYMAGIFLLRRDDEVSVITSSHTLLNRAPATTYLGMHMV